MRDDLEFAASGPFTDETWRRFYRGNTLSDTRSPNPSEADLPQSDLESDDAEMEDASRTPKTDASVPNGSTSGPNRREWTLPPKGNQANPTKPKEKYVATSRVLFMSDTGTTHTMSLHDSARYFGTPSSPNWLTPKAINNTRSSDFQNYVAIPLTADGMDCSRHILPPTCRAEFDAIWEAAMERQDQDPIVPEFWPKVWGSTTWISTG